MPPLRVTVWNEFSHEKTNETVKAIYPDGIHTVIAQHLRGQGVDVRTATLEEPEHGLPDDVLAQTDVLLWWGHKHHDAVDDAVVERVVKRVWEGMGFIALHSAHVAKPFTWLMGTECGLKWRAVGERERLWVAEPGHPIVEGLGEYIEIPHAEMYGEPFRIPTPDEVIFISWFEGGEVFRSGCTFRRGRGKIFYFRPGHETYPIYHQPAVMQVITNAVRWAAPIRGATISPEWHQPDALEPIAANE